jgi:hypothetical protein
LPRHWTQRDAFDHIVVSSPQARFDHQTSCSARMRSNPLSEGWVIQVQLPRNQLDKWCSWRGRRDSNPRPHA